MTLLRHQWELFLIAISFFTRLPIRWSIDFSEEKLNHASRYFPLVGWIIGLLCAAVFLLLERLFPINIAVLLSMLFSIFLTGAFHEDGLADTADGIGGGWTKEQKLNIMKDSRLGTYGAVAIWFVLALKFQLLTSLPDVALALIVAHPLSRTLTTGLIFWLPYVTEDQLSKVKPLSKNQSILDFGIAMASGLLALILIPQQALVVFVTITLFVIIYAIWLKRHLGGFTGDNLGAAQQISELLIYCALLLSAGVAQ
ncbi:adenosylcobinamide-GDP ribazoletransferase [Pleionea sp. CnH1-48]|uniref:adenosylcobinamide-GDP ribazoletransferase n=1 Tax=Pleionea sp. CnH1-48 TaxID=2954494 RepID=UPI0020970035|nr:adenosylcobinamide-GDP ribazoletransferase [Pleionea sp. CnH1-48]MCO7227039.1 adenosylcobinamide-GDP ribazoletransferase [Pleionea sp. CnH1-48]